MEKESRTSRLEVFMSPTFRRFLGYASKYWLWMVTSIVCGVLKFSLPLLIYVAMGYVIDHVIMEELSAAERMQRLGMVLVLLIPTYIIGIPITYGRTYFAELAGNRTIFDIRNKLYAHVQRLSLRYHSSTRTGTTTSRIINDINVSQGILDRGVMSIGVDLIFLVGVIVALFVMDWRLAAVSCATLPLYALVFGFLNPRLRDAAREVQAQMSEMSGEVNEKLAGQQVVMAFVRERSERRGFLEIHREYFKRVMRRVRLHVLLLSSGEFLTRIGPVIVIVYGAVRVIQGGMSPGDLVMFLGFLDNLYLPTRRLADSTAALQVQLSGMDRVFHLMDRAPEVNDVPGAKRLDAPHGRIEFDDVWFSYTPGRPVIRGVDLDVPAGKAVAIVGRSGGGKSTLVTLVPRFYDVDSGAIRIDGQDIRDVTQHSLRSHIGMVMQDPILFNGSIRANILYGRRNATEDDMLQASHMAHVDEFVSLMPEGYDTVIGERGVTLSGGQKQRLSIARAFLRDPRILILDEATSNLDSHAEAIIQDALGRLMQGRTSIVIAHRLSTIIDCDKVVVMQDGRVIQEGTHSELLRSTGAYRALCEEQFGAVQLEEIEAG